MNKIDLTKLLPREDWGKFFDRLSSDHRGKLISIEMIDAELGDEELIKNSPLLAMIYDRPGKGDNLAISIKSFEEQIQRLEIIVKILDCGDEAIA